MEEIVFIFLSKCSIYTFDFNLFKILDKNGIKGYSIQVRYPTKDIIWHTARYFLKIDKI